MKTVQVTCQIEDLFGVLEDLRKRDFAVLNVAVDPRGTYVYLDDKEEKDPVPLVMEWVGKPCPKLTAKEWKARALAAQAAREPRKSLFGWIKALFSRKEEPPGIEEVKPSEPAAEPPPQPVDPQFYRKIL